MEQPGPSSGDTAYGRPRVRPLGSNQEGLRQYNERVVLQAIRLHGELPKADLARMTQLSSQTVSLIVRRLLDDGLVIKREPLRGRIGQPSVPIALNPDGAYSVGVKIGRRSMDVLLVDFTGHARRRESVRYDYPDPDRLFEDFARMYERCTAPLKHDRSRLTGVGAAAPLSLGGWQKLLGVPEATSRRWNDVDVGVRLREITDMPVTVVKDTSAACLAELVAGRGRSMKTFLYLFVDTFIGGGLVIDSHLYGGAHGNAGAIGSLPLNSVRDATAPAQVLSTASLLNLQTLYEQADLDAEAALDQRALEEPWLALTQRWLQSTAPAIAFAIATSTCLLDLDHVILDGVFSRELLGRLIEQTVLAMDAHNWEGITRPTVLPGTIGSDARALGGALLPLYAAFAPDPDVFLKAPA